MGVCLLTWNIPVRYLIPYAVLLYLTALLESFNERISAAHEFFSSYLLSGEKKNLKAQYLVSGQFERHLTSDWVHPIDRVIK
jgi:hypothetical protein